MANSLHGNNGESGRVVNGSDHHGSGSSVPLVEENVGILPMPHTTTHPLDWTAEEQAILEENLAKFSNLPNILRYAKIALLLQNKTVRDVALRCRWMDKNENSRKRKEERSLTRKSKNRKGIFPDSSARLSHLSGHPSFYAGGVGSNIRDDEVLYNAIGGVNGQILRQNARAFEQISANFRAYQMHENIGLFCQARDNILKILKSLSETQEIMKQMPPLPVTLDDVLANLILPQTVYAHLHLES